jgi:2-hydroxychromene-2-carboxylate isomerase
VYRVFEYIGEETPGEETRAYLTEYVYKEIKRGIDEHGIGKRNRKLLEQKNQAVIGALIQMAEQRDGGAGSNSIPKPKSAPSRTKDSNRKTEPKTRAGV